MTIEKEHRMKMMGAITVTILCIVYVLAFIAAVIIVEVSPIIIAVGAIIAIISVVVFIYVLHERIQEIKSGEEDDLHKY